MRKGKKDIFFRIDECEYVKLIPKFEEEGGIGNFFIQASKEYIDSEYRDKVLAGEKLGDFYLEANKHLAHLGGNLNQAMKHCNELSKAGIEITPIFLNEVYPEIKECKELCLTLQKQLLKITKKVCLSN